MIIHAWVPDFVSGTGGIQTLSQFAVKAIKEIHPNARVVVFSKNDHSDPEMTAAAADEFVMVTPGPPTFRTVAFAMALIRRAIADRPDWIYVAHANFAPIGQILRRFLGIPFVVVANGIEVWEIRSWR